MKAGALGSHVLQWDDLPHSPTRGSNEREMTALALKVSGLVSLLDACSSPTDITGSLHMERRHP